MRLGRRYIVAAGFALALLGAVTWVEWRAATSAPALADQAAQTREVQTNSSELLSRVQDIETGARGLEAARQMVASGKGKTAMDQIRAEIALMNAEEQTLLDHQAAHGYRRAALRRAAIIAGAPA